MVGQFRAVSSKPGRSDEVLDEDEQLRIGNEIRAQFDAIVPKRPVKPNRSEPGSSSPNPVEFAPDGTIPELDKLRSLQSQSHDLVSGAGGAVVQEEYVETQYYKELDSIEKRHHTTGSGFIKVVTEEGAGNGSCGIQLYNQNGNTNVASGMVYSGFRSNPATNDWVPNLDHHQVFLSSKPNRSESS